MISEHHSKISAGGVVSRGVRRTCTVLIFYDLWGYNVMIKLQIPLKPVIGK